MSTQVYVNVPVKDVNASIAFFKELGFSFNEAFTNETTGFLILTDDTVVMLVAEDDFKTITGAEVADPPKSSEVAIALQVDNQEKVDEVVDKALAIGGGSPPAGEVDDFMYSRGFRDLDGHLWNVLYMDASAFPE
jgi:hypothetical protein